MAHFTNTRVRGHGVRHCIFPNLVSRVQGHCVRACGDIVFLQCPRAETSCPPVRGHCMFLNKVSPRAVTFSAQAPYFREYGIPAWGRCGRACGDKLFVRIQCRRVRGHNEMHGVCSIPFRL